MRLLYDGINSDAIEISREFPGAVMVAGYLNGAFAWTEAEWGLFPNAVHVGITVTATANYGDVLDVERFDASPGDTGGWIAMRRQAGLFRPTVYCSLATVPAVRVETGRWVLGRDYDIWVADWTGTSHEVLSSVPGGVTAPCAATQYRSTTSFDVSAVYDDGWPRRCG